MPKTSVYRSPAGQAKLLALYDDALARVPGEFARREIETASGSTSVLVAGAPDAPPVIVHQGANFPSPVTLRWFAPLLAGYRVYAPDLPGAPGHSVPRHLDARRGGLGDWAIQVMDGLGLARAPHVGASYGAGVILQGAAKAPERIERMALVMPAGVVAPRMWTLLRELALPMLRYRVRPTRRNLLACVAPLHTDPPDDLLLNLHDAVFRELRVTPRMPGPVDVDALSKARIPALVIAGEEDPLFPAGTVLERASQALPGARLVNLRGTRHFPSESDLKKIGHTVLDFLGGRQ